MLKRMLVAAALVAGLLSSSLAQPGPGTDKQMRPDDARPRREAMMKDLKLTDQQQAQMDKMRIEMKKQQVTLQGKIRLLRVEMQELLLAENPDKNAIQKKMKEVSDLQLQEKEAFVDHLFAVKGILTADQQKTWKQHMRQAGNGLLEGRMMQRHGGMKDRSCGMMQRQERMQDRMMQRQERMRDRQED
jgi:Spy/CpxP family protein refolding chaperone